MKLQDWLIIIVLGIIWGGSFLFNALMIRELGPLSISFGRVAIAAATCWIFFFATGNKLPKFSRTYTDLSLMGIINFAIPFALFPLAQKFIAVGVAGIANALTPIMVVIVSHFWPGGEKASKHKSLGVIAAFAGVSVLAIPALQQGGDSEIWALGLMIIATLCYGIAINWARHFRAVNPTFVASVALSGATIALLPFVLVFEGIPTIQNAETYWSLAYIGVAATAIPFLIIYRLLERVGATNFSTSTFIAPISAIGLGILVLGEQLLLVHVLGMIAIFVGILMIDGRLFKWLGRTKPVG